MSSARLDYRESCCQALRYPLVGPFTPYNHENVEKVKIKKHANKLRAGIFPNVIEHAQALILRFMLDRSCDLELVTRQVEQDLTSARCLPPSKPYLSKYQQCSNQINYQVSVIVSASRVRSYLPVSRSSGRSQEASGLCSGLLLAPLFHPTFVPSLCLLAGRPYIGCLSR
jgi:hypothetical protein